VYLNTIVAVLPRPRSRRASEALSSFFMPTNNPLTAVPLQIKHLPQAKEAVYTRQTSDLVVESIFARLTEVASNFRGFLTGTRAIVESGHRAFGHSPLNAALDRLMMQSEPAPHCKKRRILCIHPIAAALRARD
jgi:hypothetical protein